jgi:hypothetical protein
MGRHGGAVRLRINKGEQARRNTHRDTAKGMVICGARGFALHARHLPACPLSCFARSIRGGGGVRAVPAVASDRMSALARSAISRGAAARCRQLSTQANVLQAEIREGDGSRWARKARHQGRIPGILYGPKVVPHGKSRAGREISGLCRRPVLLSRKHHHGCVYGKAGVLV